MFKGKSFVVTGIFPHLDDTREYYVYVFEEEESKGTLFDTFFKKN